MRHDIDPALISQLSDEDLQALVADVVGISQEDRKKNQAL